MQAWAKAKQSPVNLHNTVRLPTAEGNIQGDDSTDNRRTAYAIQLNGGMQECGLRRQCRGWRRCCRALLEASHLTARASLATLERKAARPVRPARLAP